MACQKRERLGYCSCYQCQFTDRTDHGYECVMVNYLLHLCECGLGCIPDCPYSYTSDQVVTCHECGGKPNIDVGCPNCDLFGIERISAK